MLTGLENGFGLDVVVWLQAHGSPLLDFLAQAIHIVGSPAWYLLLLLPLLLRGLNRGRAYQWVFTLVIAIFLTDVLKLAFHAPRPYQVAPELVRLIVIQRSNYGLPSGHVAGALAMSGLAAVWGGRRWMWIAVVAWTLLVGWARMYAGVHYPQDVVAGVVVGAVSLWISLRYFERFIAWWSRIPLWARAAVIAFGLVVVLNVPGI
jgi:membrane-associated phospholipid phosphatase